MRCPQPNSLRRKKHQRGATLIEILVTMLIVSFGLLGVAGLQLNSVRYQQTAELRGIAYSQVQNIAERIRANAAALSGATAESSYRAVDGYANASTLPTDPACGLGSGVCTPEQSAQRDLREWRQALAAELPGGRGALATVVGGGLTSTSARNVTVMWVEKAPDSDDNLGAAPTDSNCPTPRVGGVRCISVVVYP